MLRMQGTYSSVFNSLLLKKKKSLGLSWLQSYPSFFLLQLQEKANLGLQRWGWSLVTGRVRLSRGAWRGAPALAAAEKALGCSPRPRVLTSPTGSQIRACRGSGGEEGRLMGGKMRENQVETTNVGRGENERILYSQPLLQSTSE